MADFEQDINTDMRTQASGLWAMKTVKILDADTRRIGAYATVWGELDCDGERMTMQAVAPYVNKANPLMLWMHGLDAEVGSELPGEWDAEAFVLDEVGLYAEGNIYRNAVGDRAWERIRAAGGYGLSVMAPKYLVRKRKLADGTVELTDWPLMEISIMEGGKQCVPSAREDFKGNIARLYEAIARKMGLQWRANEATNTPDGGSFGIDTIIGGNRIMAKKDGASVTADQLLVKRLAKLEALEQRMVEREAQAKIEVMNAELDVLRKQYEAGQKNAKDVAGAVYKANQPLAPVTGAGVEPITISVGSPYDRLPPLELAIRYEIMRSYGRQPSTRMWRALASQAVKMASAEQELYIKNGRPVKVPVIDWDVLVPRDLDFTEVDGSVFGVKAGRLDRFMSGGLDTVADNVTPRGIKQLAEIAAKANELVYSTQANAGDEWVPTLMNALLWNTVRVEAAVLARLPQFDMPSQPYDYPTESTDPVFYKVGESTDESQLVLTGGPFTDSKPGTAKITFSAGKLGAISYWTDEMAEDSIIAFEPHISTQYAVAMAHAIDELLLSGDETTGTTNISNDGGTIASTSRFLTLDGLRHEPLVTTTGDGRDGGTLTYDDFGITQSLMGIAGKFGVSPGDLIFICDPGVWHKAKLLSEVLTLDKFGAMATVFTGQLASVLGSPLIVSEDYSLTDTAGKISTTGGNNTKGSFICVNTRGVLVGWRRRPRIRVVGIPGAESRYIVGSARLDVGFKEAGMVAMSYNLTV